MPQISTQEFQQVPLRVHSFLGDVPLHDAWAVDLPRMRSGITLSGFLQTPSARVFALSPLARALLKIRFLVGGVLGWDRDPSPHSWKPFSERLTIADRSQSLAPPGEKEGLFSIVYRFENEQLLELVNRTVHGAVLSALIETPNAYRFYFGIYVRSIGRFTPVYMAVIDPFRKSIVYPSILRSVRTAWEQAFGST
jgi:hypothetical protein